MATAFNETEQVRVDFVPAEDYVSPTFARLEKERLWPTVWQVACRTEQLPAVGDQLVYDICDQSILVVRSSPDTIRAFYNGCPHRGRMLASGPRRTREMVCPFHGWRFNLDGKCTHIPYHENWAGEMPLDEVGLTPVRCDSWGGFVFVNLDDNCEPLLDFLGEAATRLDPFEFDKQRFRWLATVETDANWKLTLEAFMEAYHVQTTHPQLLPSFDDRTIGHTAGVHGYVTRDSKSSGLGAPSTLLKRPPPKDVRPLILEYFREMVFDVQSIFSERDMTACARIMSELPADCTPIEALIATFRFRKEAAEAAGVGWPAITPQQIAETGSIWHVFPNMVVLPQPTASLWYRARPIGNGDDPERCLLDFWALERYAPGYAPTPQNEHFTDWRDFKALPSFLAQDYDNLPYMQKGARSRGFKGARTNPVQERIISNFHAALRKHVGRE
jgi:phenylpropionate dioxygenase-like ring-hydroxylating dioxygenase large terminal subunit